MRLPKILLIIFIITLVTAGCLGVKTQEETKPAPKAQQEAAPGAKLVAVKAAKAPVIDGKSEDVWDNAKEIQVKVANAGVLQNNTGGKFDDGKTTVSVKAIYDLQNLYMQFKWADPTNSEARTPWIKEGGELVKKDPTEFYEDKLAVFWNINNSVADFNEKGCSVVCHGTDVTDEKTGKKFIKHWTNGDNELIDMWHWKLTRQNSLYGPDKPGLMHDQYMDNAQFEPKEKKGAGRHADPGEKEYKPNETEDKNQPILVHDGPPANGNPYVIVDGLDKTKPFDPAMVDDMEEGDFIAGNIARQITGDPADIKAKGKYADGTWTLEIQRPLTTTSNKDVQFDDQGKEYYFAISAFDNSQIGHAYQNGINSLTFDE